MKSLNMNALFLYVLLYLAGCSPQKKQLPITDQFLKGTRLAELKEKKLKEVSGLAASIGNPGLLWTHNDSGNDAEVYLIDLETNIKQTFLLENVDNRDWEDITVGPGPDPGKNYVYVAEIGDNAAAHAYKFVYRFEEPIYTPGESKVNITVFDTIKFQLPDSKRDTEALLIDPKTRDLYIISKYSDPVYIYQLKYPYSTKETITATKVGALQMTKIVAGDISGDGNEVLLKNYEHIYYWKNDGTKSMAQLLLETPHEVPYEVEPQGEALTWSSDNMGFYTLSEKDKDKKSFLYFYQRK